MEVFSRQNNAMSGLIVHHVLASLCKLHITVEMPVYIHWGIVLPDRVAALLSLPEASHSL